MQPKVEIPEIEMVDTGDEEELDGERPPPLPLSLDDIADFTAHYGKEIERLRDAEETAELAVEYLRFEPGLDIVGRVFSVEWVPSRFVKPGREPEQVPVLVFFGSRRDTDENGVVSDRAAMYRCYAKSAMSVLIAQPRGFEFRLRAVAKETLNDGRTRWTLSIRALRGKARI